MNTAYHRTQRDRLYRLLNGAMSPMSTAELAARLSIPASSIRRVLADLRARKTVEKHALGWKLT